MNSDIILGLIIGFLSGVSITLLIYVYVLRELLNDVIDLAYELMDDKELEES